MNELEFLVKCPCCSKQLRFKVKSADRAAQIKIKCPECGQASPFSSYRVINTSQAAAPRHDEGKTEVLLAGDHRLVTPAAPAGAAMMRNDGDTVFNANLGASLPASCGRLVFASGDLPPVTLREGRNIIGREASTSTATVRIPRTYNRVSREHLIIDVKAVGNEYRYEIRLFKSEVNTTMLNTTTLTGGDVFVLNDGDTIKLPDLAIRFEK
jgi:endogenous inhibitor of DNA gyrase (YacG/DUF329 family)